MVLNLLNFSFVPEIDKNISNSGRAANQMHDARANNEQDEHILAIRDASALGGGDATQVEILRNRVVELGKGLSSTRTVRERLFNFE